MVEGQESEKIIVLTNKNTPLVIDHKYDFLELKKYKLRLQNRVKLKFQLYSNYQVHKLFAFSNSLY